MKSIGIKLVAIISAISIIAVSITACKSDKDVNNTMANVSTSSEAVVSKEDLQSDKAGSSDQAESADNESASSSTAESSASVTVSTSSSQNTVSKANTSSKTSTNSKTAASSAAVSSKQQTSNAAASSAEAAIVIDTSSNDNYTVDELAEKIIYYINQLRVAEGKEACTPLMNGKTKAFLDLRAKQLVTNFDHDINDMKAAATEVQYGRHIVGEETRYDFETDTVIYTGNTLDYYYPVGQEAIATISAGKLDATAKRTATMFQASSGHWSYIGNADNHYISCGVYIDRSCTAKIALAVMSDEDVVYD